MALASESSFCTLCERRGSPESPNGAPSGRGGERHRAEPTGTFGDIRDGCLALSLATAFVGQYMPDREISVQVSWSLLLAQSKNQWRSPARSA